MEIKPPPELNDAQIKFTQFIFNGKNGREALYLSGYKTRGRSADAYSSLLLKNNNIQKYLQALRQDTSEKTVLIKTKFLEFLYKRATYDAHDIIKSITDSDAKLRPWSEIDGQLVDGVEVVVNRFGNKTKLKLSDRNHAAVLLAEYFGISKTGDEAEKESLCTWAKTVLTEFKKAAEKKEEAPPVDKNTAGPPDAPVDPPAST